MVDHTPEPRPQLLVQSGQLGPGWDDAAVARVSALEVKARPLRRDMSGIMGQTLMLAAVVLCPLLVAPWLWCLRERFRLNRCRVLLDGPALLVYHRQRPLLALDLRYATRQLTGAGDLVLREDAHYLALGVDPPEHDYPDSADPAAGRGAMVRAGERTAAPPAGFQLAAPGRVGFPALPIQSWRAVRLGQADLLRLRAAVAAVPTRQLPDATDVWSLLQALGSVGATGRRIEGQLARLVQTDQSQARPSGLLTMLHERALEEGPAAMAARRVLGART